jgi:hypothetical protein
MARIPKSLALTCTYKAHTLTSINISPIGSLPYIQWLELGFQSYYEKFSTNVKVID